MQIAHLDDIVCYVPYMAYIQAHSNRNTIVTKRPSKTASLAFCRIESTSPFG